MDSTRLHGETQFARHAWVALLALLVALVMSTTVSAATDPTSVVDTLDASLNAGDVDAALALFAADAQVHQTPPQPGTNGAYQGTDGVRTFLQSIVAQHIHFELAAPRQVDGERVTWTNNTSVDPWRKLGIAPLQGLGDATVHDGRIVSLTITLTPDSMQKLQAALGSAPSLPNTGAGGTASADGGTNWALLAGLTVCGLFAVGGTVGLMARRPRL
jgi:limonene-1,2-epoxide hydrolase